MDSTSNILENNSLEESLKGKMINTLIAAKLENKENINIDDILNVTTNNVELKCEVFEKVVLSNNNLEASVYYFMEYFKKTCHNIESQQVLARILLFLLEILKDSDKTQNLLENLGVENVNELMLNKILLQESENEENGANLKKYIDYLSFSNQVVFFNQLFEFSKMHKNVNLLRLSLDNINNAVLTDEKSVFQTKDFWIFLTNSLKNCKCLMEMQEVILVLETCINLCKNANLQFQFLSLDNDEKAWNAFLALVQVSNYKEKKLLKPSLELLKYISSLHFFWQLCVLKLLVKVTTNDLTCQILIYFLKKPIEAEYLQPAFETIFFAINKLEDIKKCPVFKELQSFCENLNIKHFSIILDEVLKISWNFDAVEMVVENVLVESKKILIDFGYFYRFEAFLKMIEKETTYWPKRAATAVLVFFGNSKNFDNECEIRRSSIRSNYYWQEHSEHLRYVALKKILELSNKNSEDFDEMQVYFSFARSKKTYGYLLKKYSLSIHVRILIYKLLFNMDGYIYAEYNLDQAETTNDFSEYLLQHLNENTYIMYTSLMTSFLDLMDNYMIFEFPKKACSEIVNITQYPELYTKHQIYCAAEILRVCYYRFHYIWGVEENSYYEKIAIKWKNLILETEDDKMCIEGLYYVLGKGQLNEEEYNEIVKKLLKKHLCDNVAEEIYRRYISPVLMHFALKHLSDIKQNDPNKYEQFSQLFCEAVMFERYINSKQFCYKNEEYKFCFLNTKNLEYSMSGIYNNLLDYSELKRKTMEITFEIYWSKLINIETKINCLHVLVAVVSNNKFNVGPPPPFLEPFKEDITFILKKCQEAYKANLKDDIIKLRIVQALFLLIYYLKLDCYTRYKYKPKPTNIHRKLRNNLKRITVGILVKEKDSTNKAVRQICQHMYILLSENNVIFNDIKCIAEKIKEKPDLAHSFMPVLYHIMSFHKFSETELKEMFEYLVFWLQIQDDKLKVYSQFLFQRIYNLYNNQKFRNIIKNVIKKYETTYEQIELDLENNKNRIADLLDVDYIFLKILEPKRDHSLETLLYILPKLNRVDSNEWKGIINTDKIWCAFIGRCNDEKDKNETLKQSVDEFLENQENVNNKYFNYSAEDVLEMFKLKPNKKTNKFVV